MRASLAHCLVLLSVLQAVDSFFVNRQTTASRTRGRHAVVARSTPCKVEVCVSGRGKYCKRKGSAKVLALFESLAPDGITVEATDCLDECTMGPNVRLDEDDRRVINGVRTAAQVAEILGVAPPEEVAADE